MQASDFASLQRCVGRLEMYVKAEAMDDDWATIRPIWADLIDGQFSSARLVFLLKGFAEHLLEKSLVHKFVLSSWMATLDGVLDGGPAGEVAGVRLTNACAWPS